MTGASLVGLATAAQAVPGTPGVPQANTVVFEEDFENGPGTLPQQLDAYTGSGGQTYTAAPYWLSNCNGMVVNFNVPYTAQGNCAQAVSSANLRQLAYALGVHAGAASPGANDAVAAYTEGSPLAALAEFQTVSNIPLASANGRFLTFSVDTAAVNCAVSPPLYQFAFLNEGGVATNVGGVLNACSSGTTVPVPAVGPLAAQSVNVGTYTSNGSVLFSGSSLGIRMINQNQSGVGNDAAFDNIRILDVTPQLDKTFSPSTVPSGGTSTLTFTVTNTDELASKAGWGFTDALPAGLTIANPAGVGGTCVATTTAVAGGTSISVTGGSLAAGQVSCTITVEVTSPVPGSFTNGPDDVTPVGLNEPGDATVVFESPELSLTKRAGTPVDVNGNGVTDEGDTIQYEFDVTNSGDVSVTDLAINDPLVGAVTCAATTLAAGADTTCVADSVYTITAADASAGSVDNTATASGTSPSGEEITSDPSTTSTPVVVADPSLTIVKSADPSGADTYDVGQVITYSFVVTNTGNLTLNDVVINEEAFSGTGDLSAITCPATTLTAGAQMICEATYTLTVEDVDAGSVTNTATASGTPAGSTTPIDSTPSDATVPVLAEPGISVVKSADLTTVTAAGQTVNYSFLVTNTGNVSLADVAISEDEFSGSGDLSPIACPATTLVPGQIVTCTATYMVTQADIDAGGVLSNTATAGGTPPGSDTPVPSTPSTVDVPVDQTPSVAVVKTADVVAAEVGQTVTYSFLVTNTGNVTVTDPTINEVDFSGTGELSAILCPADVSLAPGEDVTCTATYTVTQADVNSGAITNTATATGTTPDGGTTPTSAPSTEVVTTDPLPALSVVKTADRQQVTAAGQVVTYSFDVSNIGNVTITSPTVTEASFNGNGTLSAITCPADVSPLEPGETFTCTATYTVVAADLTDGGDLVNTATASGTTPSGDPITSTPSTATVDEVAPAAATAGDLAVTGGTIAWSVIGIALLLIAAGGVILFVRRRNGTTTEV